EFSDLIQTDAAINQGNSGGALLDITGKLVGINNAMAVGAENIGFAIPMDVVRKVFEDELTQRNSFATALDAPWLGIEVVERGSTVLVSDVLVGSPADRAGVEPGDELASIKGHEVRGLLDYQRQLVTARAEQPLPITLRRSGKALAIDPVPTTRTEWLVRRALGCEFEELTAEQDRKALYQVTLAYFRGTRQRQVRLLPGTLRVTSVEPGSPADGLLQPGDLVFACVVRQLLGDGEMRLTTRRELHDQLRTRYGQAIKLAVLRDDRDFYTTVDVRALSRR
ncbi:MAG: PDZ domain-containing protein, partial [Planctomycetes bacterium]|nr:PDZ domain-containing protein [Planctomycetota bacterium]